MTDAATPALYAVHIRGLETSLTLLEESSDLVGAVMKATEHVGRINEAMKQKFPDTDENEFVIDAIHLSEIASFLKSGCNPMWTVLWTTLKMIKGGQQN